MTTDLPALTCRPAISTKLEKMLQTRVTASEYTEYDQHGRRSMQPKIYRVRLQLPRPGAQLQIEKRIALDDSVREMVKVTCLQSRAIQSGAQTTHAPLTVCIDVGTGHATEYASPH